MKFLKGRACLVAIVATLALSSTCVARPGDLWPEIGIFADSGAPQSYDQYLKRAFFQNDDYRLCLLVTIPSSAPESAVYFVKDSVGNFTVVSQSLKQPLWQQTNQNLFGNSDGKPLDAQLLRKLALSVVTRRAPLDKEAAGKVGELCKKVLLRVRYPSSGGRGPDGTDYHAGHWIFGRFLSGETWSPDPGTVSGDFVAMEVALKAYADAESSQRSSLRARLLAKAQSLEDLLDQIEKANVSN
jgi:hypothetical protein